ncbi:MAG: FAD:protein FMN transferase [Candidatus Latescibacterota bacterium]
MKKGAARRLAKYGIAALLVGGALWWHGLRRPHDEEMIADSRFYMDTLVTIKAWGGDAAQIEALLDKAFGEIERLEGVMSVQILDSEVSRINEGASGAWMQMSSDVASVLGRAQFFAEASDGACDVTIAPALRLWGFATDAPGVPDAQDIGAALDRVGFDKIEIDKDKVHFRKPGMAVDLGAIAKGYAVDQAVRVLEDGGASGGLVEAGGDLRFFGTKPGGKRWRIALAHPRNPGELIEIGEMPLHSVATSGDYERFFEEDGKRYHHLIDPRTGYPARRAVSATVWARTCMDADMLSTALFVKGPDGIAWVQGLGDVEGWVIYEVDGGLRSRASAGLMGKVHFPSEGQ